MRKIRVQFVNVYSTFVAKGSFYESLLSKHFEVDIVDETPDLVVTSAKPTLPVVPPTIPILLISVEAHDAWPGMGDILMAPRHFESFRNYIHFTNVATYDGMVQLLAGKELPNHIKTHRAQPKTKFCAFLYKNQRPRERKRFCKALMRYKYVDCLGAVLRNTTTLVPKEHKPNENWTTTQLGVYKDYKFTIAFENTALRGYICEKITQPILAGSIPIYWGAPEVEEYINPEAFIHVRNFRSYKACIDHIKEVDHNPELYQKYRAAPIFLPDSKFYDMAFDRLSDQLKGKLDEVLAPNYTPIKKISPAIAALKCKRSLRKTYRTSKYKHLRYAVLDLFS